MILAGDIGGTKTNVALFERRGADLEPHEAAHFDSSEHAGLAEILTGYLAEREVAAEDIAAACFGIAGPVEDNAARTTNLPWHVVGAEVARKVGVPSLTLINDLVATAEGALGLPPDRLAVLQEGDEHPGEARAVIAAGTGLGMAIVPPGGGPPRPSPSEGGHSDFPAQRQEEMDLVAFVRREIGPHVSIDRIVSGPGLERIYRFLRARSGSVPDAEVEKRMAEGDAPEVISAAGMEDGASLCGRALDLFVRAFGAVAGNLALISLARGGVYVAGGIAPQILDKLRDGTFIEAFVAKGRFRDLLGQIPVRVVLDPRAAVLGAARHAAAELGR